MRHRSVLEYQRYFYLKIAIALVAGAILLYIYQRAPVGRYGGTAAGYALGTVAALLIVWLMWFGLRKRHYHAARSSMQGWLSAHIYLGATLVVITTLHAAFQIGWNVHTLAYALLLLVVASGFFGIYAYLRFPTEISENLGEETLASLLDKIGELDQEADRLSTHLGETVVNATRRSITETKIGGGVFNQLRVRHPNCPTEAAIRLIESGREQANLKGEAAQRMHELYAVMLRKRKLVARARTDVRFRAILAGWLFLHVPLSFALLAALVAHIVSVFFYW